MARTTNEIYFHKKYYRIVEKWDNFYKKRVIKIQYQESIDLWLDYEYYVEPKTFFEKILDSVGMFEHSTQNICFENLKEAKKALKQIIKAEDEETKRKQTKILYALR